jgi:hypothetical protein
VFRTTDPAGDRSTSVSAAVTVVAADDGLTDTIDESQSTEQR